MAFTLALPAFSEAAVAPQKVRVSSDHFTRIAMIAIGGLMTFAVNFLGQIAHDINDLKVTVAVIADKTDSQGRDIEKLKTAVFNGKP